MKTTAAIIVCACLAAIVVGDGWIKSRRAGHKTQTLQATVAALSPQELAMRVRDCEPADVPVPTGPTYNSAYCAEVMRAVDNQPLQIVTPPRAVR